MQVLGLMSGTSLDGLDMALVDFYTNHDTTAYKILASNTVTYPDEWIDRLNTSRTLSGYELTLLDSEYGKWIASQVNAQPFVQPHQLDLISSHGHTVFHAPSKQITLQIGHPQMIASHTKIPTIANFRQKDVMLGGQGAPLVPIGDHLLFGQYDICINIGGIANLSFVDETQQRRAFDICFANIPLNYLARKKNKKYDHQGNWAKSGQVIPALLTALNKHPYLQLRGAKSLGIESFERDILPLLAGFKEESINNLLSTFTTYTAQQLITTIKDIILKKQKGSSIKILVTGGGVKNKYLMDLCRHILTLEKLKQVAWVDDKHTLIDYKEAVIFGFLGFLSYHQQINCLRTVTGAKVDSCTGNLYTP